MCYPYPYLNVIYENALKINAKVIVELGTGAVGYGAKMFSDVCKLTGGIVYTIDISEERQEEARERLKDRKNIIFMQSDSIEAGLKWDKGDIDVLFCDSDHTYVHVMKELETWSKYNPKLIFVHDTLDESLRTQPPFEAARNFAEERGKDFINFTFPYGLGLIVDSAKSYVKWVKLQEERYAEEEVTREALSLQIQRERIDIAMSWIEKDETVLDLGAGDCSISEIIRDKGNAVVSLDFPRVLRRAKNKVHRISLVGGEATNLPFRDGSVSTVFCGELMEHILNIKRLLSEIHRILTDEGKLVLTTPNMARLRNRLALLIGDISPWHEYDKDISHIRYWTPQTLIECLKQNGFEPLKYGAGRSLGEGPPISGWDIFTAEERKVLEQIISRFTPHPYFLQTFIVIEARKV